MNMNRIEQLMQKMKEQMDPELIAEMQKMTHILGILIGVKTCKSLDHEVLTDQIFKDKQGDIPREIISDVVTEVLPEVLAQGMITSEGILTDESLWMAEDYEKRLER